LELNIPKNIRCAGWRILEGTMTKIFLNLMKISKSKITPRNKAIENHVNEHHSPKTITERKKDDLNTWEKDTMFMDWRNKYCEDANSL
jgi:hypothetical protein